MRRNIFSTLETGAACSSKTYKIKQYGKPAHNVLNKEIVDACLVRVTYQ
jgi:hypothetical protein